MVFAPCGDRAESPASSSVFNFAMFKCGLDLIYFRYYLCCESMMVFAPGGDGGCPHQPVSGIVYTTSYCVYCEAFGTQVFGGGVIRGRIQTKRRQVSWTGHDNNYD